MLLRHIKLANFRNIREAELVPSTGANLIYGQNASGKTSLLESIYFLGHLRSFRSSSLADIINREAQQLELISRIDTDNQKIIPLGIRRSKDKLEVRANQQSVTRVADIAALFPVIAIHPESYRLITGSPAQRRQYMDWGVFHVEHAFFDAWQKYRKALSQRNASLKTGHDQRMCRAWDNILDETASQIDVLRRQYLAAIKPHIETLGERFFPGKSVRMEYRRGWKAELSLQQVLKTGYEQDRRRGFTQQGPHRAELVFKIDDLSVQHSISRGQQKLMVALLRLAQASHYTQVSAKSCVLLYDDLAAELDSEHRNSVMSVLKDLPVQLFVSSIERDQIDISSWAESTMFHVEHGSITHF